MMCGSGLVGLLLAAAAGYWVLERSSERKGQLKKVGLIVGSIIVVGSLLAAVCSVWCGGTSKAGMCSFSGKMGKGHYRGMPGAPGSPK